MLAAYVSIAMLFIEGADVGDGTDHVITSVVDNGSSMQKSSSRKAEEVGKASYCAFSEPSLILKTISKTGAGQTQAKLTERAWFSVGLFFISCHPDQRPANEHCHTYSCGYSGYRRPLHAADDGGPVREAPFLSRAYIKTINLPRQARDKHRKS